jgi:hypothetical protein
MQLRVSEGLDKPAAAAYKRELEANEQAAVVALRLRGFDQVHVGPRIRQLFGGGISWEGNPLTRTSVLRRAVEGGDARALRGTFAKSLSELKSEGGLAVALRRFSGSFEPRHEQDRFLDLWIAMESLFGTEGSNEVTFRLSLNAANFAITNGSRRDVFDWVQRCYRVRSKLVHGGHVSPGKVKRLSGEPAGRINDLSDDLLSIVGSALRRRLSGPADPDWVHLALRK